MRNHQLPPETLAQIFLETQCYNSCKYPCSPINRDLTYPVTISSVCRTWRRVSLGLPELWSHIDLVTQWVSVTDAEFNRFRLLEERSSGAFVDLCIRVCKDPTVALNQGGWIDEVATEEDLAQLVGILIPPASRVRGLHIHSTIYTASELQPILASIMKVGINMSLDTLTICPAVKLLGAAPLLPWAPGCMTEPPDDGLIYQFMRPVRSLRLNDALILWTMSDAYFGLTELSVGLTDGIYFPGSDNMALILSSCPELRLLSLKNVVVDSYIPPDPIILGRLQRLELQCDRPEYLTPLLRFLQPQNQCLAIKIDIAKEVEFVEQLQAFLRRTSGITTLHARPEDTVAWFSSLCTGLHKLSVLTLEECDFSDPELANFVLTERSGNRIVPWPSLCDMHLVRCILDLDTLNNLTVDSNLERLELVECVIRDPVTQICTPATLSILERLDISSGTKVLVRDQPQ